MNLSNLKPNNGARTPSKRVGRGPGSGTGKTSGSGHKGDKARGNTKSGFEGGQTPLHRRLPQNRGIAGKGGFNAPPKAPFAVVNLSSLERFDNGATVTLETLFEAGLIGNLKKTVKILGNGELTKKLIVRATQFSKSAQAKIEAAGGVAELEEKWDKTENKTELEVFAQRKIKMGEIALEGMFSQDELSALPVLIQARNRATGRRTRPIRLTDDSLTLPVGVYALLATLPSGDERTATVTVVANDRTQLNPVVGHTTQPATGEQLPLEALLGENWVGALVPSLPDIAAKGNLLSPRSLQAVALSPFESYGAKSERLVCAIPGREAPQMILIAGENANEEWYLSVPAFFGTPCSLHAFAILGGGYRLDVHLSSVVADALMRYLEQQRYAEIEFLLDSGSFDFDHIMTQKNSDVFLTLAIAYAIIKVGRDLQNLKGLSTWLEENVTIPDAQVIAAEYHSRNGHLTLAASALLGMTDFGLPIFRLGLSLATSLTQYLTLRGTSISDDLKERLKDLQATLSEVSSRTDSLCPLLCYSKDVYSEI